MKITDRKSNIKTIRQSDPDFAITNGLLTTSRAGFEINQHCPDSYKYVLLECIQNGWIKPVAYMTQQEYFMEKLKK